MMSAARCHRPLPRSAAGMTLLEMLLVIALVAISATLAVMAMGGGREGQQLRNSVRELTAQLRYTRTQAIVHGQPQQFRIEPASGRWEAANGRHGQLPERLRVRFTGAAQLQPSAGIGAIAFYPDGGASGGRIELLGARAGWQLDVAWITGQVQGQAIAGAGR